VKKQINYFTVILDTCHFLLLTECSCTAPVVAAVKIWWSHSKTHRQFRTLYKYLGWSCSSSTKGRLCDNCFAFFF